MTVLYLLSQRILEEDEVIEQGKIKQAPDLQFHKRWQPFQSVDEHTYGNGLLVAKTLSLWQ